MILASFRGGCCSEGESDEKCRGRREIRQLGKIKEGREIEEEIRNKGK